LLITDFKEFLGSATRSQAKPSEAKRSEASWCDGLKNHGRYKTHLLRLLSNFSFEVRKPSSFFGFFD
jgi:hypothetical protein